MADQMGRDEEVDRGGIPERSGGSERPEETEDLRREAGSPLGTDPQEASRLPGDPREPQQTQEPRSAHIAPDRAEGESHPAYEAESSPRERNAQDDGDQGVVDQLREAWDRMRGKK